MIIIVDAYNLLRAVPPYKKTITDKERSQFITQLNAYGRRKGHKIIVVFDGGPYEWPFKEQKKIITVVYSGIHETADDYIKKYIETYREKDLLLVSSDSELNRWAARYNIPSIDSSSFYQLLHQELSTKESASTKQQEVVKLMHNEEDKLNDIDVFMMESIKKVPVKSEDFAAIHKSRNIKKDKSSKHERALLKKLNKL
jgi:uncharacterized protein